MNYKKARAWQDILLFGGAFVAGVGVWGFDSTFLGLLGLAMVLLSILVWWLYYRCPQCHESLGRGNPKHCPHCGAWLGDEPEPEEKPRKRGRPKKTDTAPEGGQPARGVYEEIRDLYNTICTSFPKVRSLSEAAKAAGISRSALYKYKDCVFVHNEALDDKVITLSARLEDRPGVLSGLLNSLSEQQGNILTVNQNIPVDGVAAVSLPV